MISTGKIWRYCGGIYIWVIELHEYVSVEVERNAKKIQWTQHNTFVHFALVHLNGILFDYS